MLEIAKLIYDAIGIESPRKFIVVCAIFGAIAFAGLGWLIAKGAQAKIRETQSVPATSKTGNAKTNGAESPAVTGSGNNITYGSPPNPPAKGSNPPK